MNTIKKFPSYFQASSVDGNAIALIAAMTATSFIILTPIARPDQSGLQVQVSEVATEQAVTDYLGTTRIVPVSVEAYNKVLFDDWKFDGSENYRAVESEESNADNQNETETTPPATTPGDENPGGTVAADDVGNGAGSPTSEADTQPTTDGSPDAGGEPAPAEPQPDAGTPADADVPAGQSDDGDGSVVQDDDAKIAEPSAEDKSASAAA